MLGRCRQYGDPRLLEVTEERNGPSGLRDDDDDGADCDFASPVIDFHAPYNSHFCLPY